MKTSIYQICLFSFLLLLTPLLKAQITFTDVNFEKSIREKVERGWFWIPNYSGSDYQFTEEDLVNISYLSFDTDEFIISSLEDLKWFPNLYTLHIWDASQISDFSPVWELSDKIEDLVINGSTEAKITGISVMNKLVSLDLGHNYLTSLSFLGSHPDLMYLFLAENYLDLGDSEISFAIRSLSEQITEKRNELGWWWYSDSVEYEPQYPKSFQNLTTETSRVQQIIYSSPSDAEANLLRGLYTLFEIFENTEASGLKEFAVSVGVDPSVREFVLSDLSMLESYDAELQSSFQFRELAELFEDSIVPDLEETDRYFANILSSSVITLQPDITGSDETVTVDYADILVLRTITNLLAGLASLQSGYDWDLNAGHMESLDDTDNMSAEQIRAHNSNFAGIRSATQLAKAKVFLQTAIDLYQIASPLLTDFSRLDIDNRLFVLSMQDLADEADFREALLDMESALSGPHAFEDGGDRIDLSRLFAGQVNLAQLLPENKNNKFATDQMSDPTMGGFLPDFTQRRVSQEIQDENLLWDERAIVFWRWESFKNDPYSATSWNKQSVVLRYLGDDSEEVLFSVNARDLVNDLGLDPSTNSYLWLEESKVCISPDGTQLVFGYALVNSMVSMFEERYLVRILNYDIATRSSSIVREWTGTNLSDSVQADYVNFCIDALAVDWAAEKIYFTEQQISGAPTSSIDYEKLLSCDFNGQNLSAVKKFDRKTTTMGGTLPSEIDFVHIQGGSSPVVRVTVNYDSSMDYLEDQHLYTIDAFGSQLIVPIENQNAGDPMNRSMDSFSPFSLSEDGSEIYFPSYENDSANNQIKELVINKMTDQGYDQKTIVDLWSLSYRDEIWGYWANERRPNVVMMSDVNNGKIYIGLEYLDYYNQVANPEILELDLASGDYNVLTAGKIEYTDSIMLKAYDDFSTVSVFYPNGAVEPPQTTTDSDGDGLPDDVEIAAGMNPNSSDKAVVDAVYNYFFHQGEGTAKSLQKATPHTYNWYFQPEMGWMWTDHSTFPYIFKSSSDGQTGSWMYFSEQSANPIKMYDYSLENWLTLGE